MSVKDINIKNGTYHHFNDTIYIENFDPNNIKMVEKSYKNILFYYIGYVTTKKDLNTYNVNPLYFGKLNRYFEEINGNTYLSRANCYQ